MDAASTAQAVARAVTQATGASPTVLMRSVMDVAIGQVLAARVLGAEDGQVQLSVAGQRVLAQSDVPLAPGQTVRLQVAQMDADRVALRIVPETPQPGASAQERAATQAPGLPPAAGRALMAALDALPAGARPDPGTLTQLSQRAVAAGVQTPAQADAFIRLTAAGLPATAAAVAGMAELTEGPPLGRALAMVVDAATRPPAGAAAPSPATPAPIADPQGARTAAPSGGPPAPSAPAPPGPVVGAPAVPGATPATAQAPATAATPSAPVPDAAAATRGGQAGAPPPTTPALTTEAAADARSTARTGPATGTHASTPQATALASLVDDVAARAVTGDPVALRQAISDLGHGLERRLHTGEPVDQSVRSLLLAVARDADTPTQAARMAERTVDALAAQNLAPCAFSGAQADPATQGAYLQVPLPGGQNAEVRVLPDADGDGPGGASGRPVRVAFLLNMSALGSLVVDASVGPGGAEATVRAGSEAVRTFLTTRADELAEGLARATGADAPVRVAVERTTPAGTARLLPAPPTGGLDVAA